MRAGNVVCAASRQRTSIDALYPGSSIFPSDTKPIVTGNRSGRVYWVEMEIPGNLTDRRGRVYLVEMEIPA